MALRTLKNPVTYIEYFAMIAAGCILRVLPISLSSRFGEGVARFFGLLSHRPERFVELQMRATFDDKFTDTEYKSFAKKFFRHLGCLIAEGVRLKQLNKDTVDSIVEWGESLEILKELKAKNQGVIIATGHIGNWEFTGAATALAGYLAGSIARPLDNPLIDKLVNNYRESSGNKIWAKQGALLNVMRSLKKGKSVGILVDQDAGENGLSVPFLGRPASTIAAVAEMAIRLKAPIYPAAIQRTDKPMHFRANTRELIYPNPDADPEQEKIRILTEMNAALSDIIMDAPEQWLWTHRRWKTPNPVSKL